MGEDVTGLAGSGLWINGELDKFAGIRPFHMEVAAELRPCQFKFRIDLIPVDELIVAAHPHAKCLKLLARQGASAMSSLIAVGAVFHRKDGQPLLPARRQLAQFTECELAKVVQFQKEENQVMREQLPGRLRLTPQQRQRLLKYGKPLGKKLDEVITIVSPRTFARWASGETKSVGKKEAKPGRKKTADEIRELILKIARETGAGYTKILGELKKLGINSFCRSSVVNILRENGLDPGPTRGEDTWEDFVKLHAETLWATDRDYLPPAARRAVEALLSASGLNRHSAILPSMIGVRRYAACPQETASRRPLACSRWLSPRQSRGF